jgi:hypothetical protein
MLPLQHTDKNGRGDRIRTCDPLVPNQMRYQTALLPVFNYFESACGAGASDAAASRGASAVSVAFAVASASSAAGPASAATDAVSSAGVHAAVSAITAAAIKVLIFMHNSFVKNGTQDRIRTYILLPVTFGSVRSGEGYLGMERIARIELASSAWKAVIIPLYDIRIKLIYTKSGTVPAALYYCLLNGVSQGRPCLCPMQTNRSILAIRTGLEPVASCVTGKRSNQLI